MVPIRISKDSMWQTTVVDHYVAEELFGWKWYSYVGRPVRSHPEYPKEMRVRRFYPPLESLNEQWQRYLKDDPHEPATGDEPLCYCYESSNGPHMVPHFSGHEDACKEMEREIHRRGLWDKYQDILAAILVQDGDENPPPLALAPCERRCLAALCAVGSKYVIHIEEPL